MGAFHCKELLLQLIELDETVSLDHNLNVCNDIMKLNWCLMLIHLQWDWGGVGDCVIPGGQSEGYQLDLTFEHICRTSPGTPSLLLHVLQRINLP